MTRGSDDLRFYIDPATGQPHIYEHGVTEEEVEEVLTGRYEDYPSDGGTRVANGQTLAGRYLMVVYTPGSPLYVVTSRELRGRELAAFRRRTRGGRRGRR